MKKLFLSLTVLAISSMAVEAQNATFGVKAGMTAASMKFSTEGFDLNFDTKIGFYAGVLADIGVSENFAVQPELFYSSMGAKVASDGETGKYDLGYINLPVLAKYKKDGLSIFLGPQIGYLLSAKTKADGESMDIKEELKSTEVSGIIGVGYTLMSGFGFDARYQLGLTDIAKDSEGEGSVKNSAFMVGVHYKFNQQ